ncbi:MAG: glycosyltransferase family 2 protein, partial [Deltaproteobacteria bacterium]
GQILKVNWEWPLEMVFVDDCSKDNSWNVLQGLLALHKEALLSRNISVQQFQHPVNRGKGVAIQKAISLATGEVLIVQDADGEYSPSEIPSLVNPILDGKADVVFGSRFRQNVTQAHRTYHYMVNRLLTLLSNLASGLHLTDMETCYKAFRRDVLVNILLRSERFGFEPEVTAHIARLKLVVWELPISYYPRSYIEGKKITWKDGIAALWHILYFNFLCPSDLRFSKSMPQKYLLKKWQLNQLNSPLKPN